MFIGEGDTGEPFSIGLKVGKLTYYLKAENRLELDNWSRVLKPFVQASQAYIPRRSSSTSSTSSTESADVFAQGELSTCKFSLIDCRHALFFVVIEGGGPPPFFTALLLWPRPFGPGMES